MVKRDLFHLVSGFDEDFSVNFNDVDFCLKLRKEGYLNIFIPHVHLYHHEKATREKTEPDALISKEILIFRKKWKTELMSHDPYLNVNIPRSSEQEMEEFINLVCMDQGH